MPRRSNIFQDVVAIIHQHMAEGATVEESAMLEDRGTGEQREVDVVIRTEAAGHDVAVAVEAAGRSRPATVEWVDQMIGKHANLPTDKLALVSQSGFTAQARTRAETAGAIVLAPADLEDGDPVLVVVNRLRSLWPKVVSWTPEQIGISVGRRGDEEAYKAPPSAELIPVFLDDGRELGTLDEAVRATIGANFEKSAEQIGLRDMAEDVDVFFDTEIGPPWTVEVDGEKCQVCVRYEGTSASELRPINKVKVLGKVAIRVSEIPLTHRRLGEIAYYSVGEGKIGDQEALVVATEDKGGGKLTFRIRPPKQPELRLSARDGG